MSKKNLRDCPECGQPISQQAMKCPACGATVPNEAATGCMLVVAVFVAFCLLLGTCRMVEREQRNPGEGWIEEWDESFDKYPEADKLRRDHKQ